MIKYVLVAKIELFMLEMVSKLRISIKKPEPFLGPIRIIKEGYFAERLREDPLNILWF